jgi:DNA-binding FadR family transcriptional regulator
MPQAIRSTTAARAAVFAPLGGAGRAELVEQRLTDAIVLGLLSHGERLPSESEMARQFGVATVTAREALEALRSKGLVETKRGRDGGSFVTSTSRAASIDQRVRDLSRVELRDMGVYYSAIACMAAELAADRATPDDIEQLQRTLTDASQVPDEARARREEGTFRLEIAALAQSARLVREELRLQAEFAPLLWLCLRDEDYRASSRAAHQSVVDAIAAGNGGLARTRTAEHITGAIEWLLGAKE